MLGLAGRKAGKPHALQVMEIQKDGKAERLPFVPALDWDNEWLRALAGNVCGAMFNSHSLCVTDTADGKTDVEVYTVDKLPLPEAKVAEALSTIFHAIGKAHGREVNVSFKVSK